MTGRIMLDILENSEPHRTALTTLANGERWTLDGWCNQCGDCCRGHGTPVLVTEVVKMFAPHRLKEVESAADCVMLKKRPDIDAEGRELYGCSCYGTRPYTCAILPVDPYQPLPARCSYTWRRL